MRRRHLLRKILSGALIFVFVTLNVICVMIGVYEVLAAQTVPEKEAYCIFVDEDFEVPSSEKLKANAKATIYLTFDDGPSEYTAELLGVLKKYRVKATFFVTGRGEDEMILREFEEGHAVGLHTLTHNYASIYISVEAFFEDLEAVQARVERITGMRSSLMRFPGGSSNTVSRKYDGGARIMSRLVQEVEERGYTYFDWNADSDDAGRARSPEEVFENVTGRFGEGADLVVLQHDTKDYSVAAVESIIKYGLENGFWFEKLDAGSFAAHHSVNN